MTDFEDIVDLRRRLLVKALTGGFLSAALPVNASFAWDLFGRKPKKLSPDKSIFRISGKVSVNGKLANMKTIIRPGDIVETEKNSEIIFVVGDQSMIMRSNTRLEIEGEENLQQKIIRALRLLGGKLLAVSRHSQMRLTTATAVMGIRGTGWYAESDPDKTYFCTCYGTTDVSASNDPDSRETVVSMHHDKPLYILADAERGQSIRNAPFKNHTDQELMLIEALVGRTPPFTIPRDEYSGPRRDY